MRAFETPSAAQFGQTPLDQRDDLTGEPRQKHGKLNARGWLASGHKFTRPQEKVGGRVERLFISW